MTAVSDTAAIPVAAHWLLDVLLGSVATGVAVIAVAATGLAMLAGRIDWRRGMRVIAGCFVLFGAPAISAGLISFTGSGVEEPQVGEPSAIDPAPVVATPAPPPAGYDPYAGAAVPVR